MSQGPSSSFGVRLAGVGLLLPGGEALDYLASAPVYPLPQAARRVVGLTQLRGHPVVVLDGAVEPLAPASTVFRMPVLVIGAPPDGAALVVDAPPQAVRVAGPASGTPRPQCPFADALEAAVGDDAGQAWWIFDARRLFATLAEAA